VVFQRQMLRASLFRLPFIVTFLTATALGMLLELLTSYYYSVPHVHSPASHFASYKLQRYNVSRIISSQMWHFHNMVCVHLFCMEECT